MAGKNYIDPLLSNAAKGYTPVGHINELVMPVMMVKKDTGKIADFGADNMRLHNDIKAPEGKTPTISTNVSIGTGWVLENHSLKALAADEHKENQDKPFDVERDAARFVMDVQSIGREKALADFMNDDSNFTNTVTLSGTSQWGGSADDPLGDINTAIADVSDALGIPDEEVSLVVQMRAWRQLISLDEILLDLGFARQGGTSAVRPAQLAAALNIKQIIIAKGHYNTAPVGAAASLSTIWVKHAWAVFIPSAPSLRQRPFGWTFKKSDGPVVDKWRDNDRKGVWVRATDKYDQFVCEELAVSMVKDAVA